MKKMICCVLVACSLLLGACQSTSAQNETDTHDAAFSVIERDGSHYLHDRYGNEIQGYQFPNRNLEFHLPSGKWLILDENGEVLYDDIDDMSSDFHAFTYLEDGSTLHRYFHTSESFSWRALERNITAGTMPGLGGVFASSIGAKPVCEILTQSRRCICQSVLPLGALTWRWEKTREYCS